MMAYFFVLADSKHLQLYLLADLDFKETLWLGLSNLLNDYAYSQ